MALYPSYQLELIMVEHKVEFGWSTCLMDKIELTCIMIMLVKTQFSGLAMTTLSLVPVTEVQLFGPQNHASRPM